MAVEGKAGRSPQESLMKIAARMEGAMNLKNYFFSSSFHISVPSFSLA